MHKFIKFFVKAFEKSASAREHDVLIESPSVVHWARLDRVIYNLVERGSPVSVHELGVEEHLRTQESLVAHIDLDGLASVGWFVNVLLEFVREIIISVTTLLLLIILSIFLHEVFADISVFLLDSPGDLKRILTRHGLLSITELTKHELSDVPTSERNVLDTATNDEAVSNGEDVRNTISGVDDHTREIMLAQIVARTLWSGDLRVKREDGLHTNKESFYAEGLEHDFGDLLPILWRVEWRLGEDEPVLLRFASQIGVNGFVPELLDALPVFNLPTSKKIANLMGFLVSHGLFSDVVVHLIAFKFSIFL